MCEKIALCDKYEVGCNLTAMLTVSLFKTSLNMTDLCWKDLYCYGWLIAHWNINKNTQNSNREKYHDG